MDSGDVSIRNLEGPYSYHLYIGFAPSSKNIVRGLYAKLQKQGVICYLRDQNVSIKESIREGVRTSQKCLLYLTSDYVKDNWYQIETSTVIEKSERFSRDVVIILKSEDLEVIPERLREFKTQPFKPEKLNDEKFLAQFVDVITREPDVRLAVLPKQNIGYGSAYGYYYGFLRLVLPDFKKRLIEETLRNDPDLVQKTVQKMLIIMPESCFCAIELKSPNQIEFTDKFVVRVANRAGNQKRDYKSSLYKLIDHEQEYYFVGELATPLLTMYETYAFDLCGMTKDQLYIERDAFYFTLKAILSHPDNADCNDQFKLLYWSDPETQKPNQLDLYNFLLPVLRDELLLQRQNERNPSKIGTIPIVRSVSSNRRLLNTFEALQVDGANPARIYEEISKYQMDHRPRGLCLIVNIANFEKGHTNLKPRRGSEKDAELLKKLFTDLHFEVQVHNDVNAQTLESLFLTMHIADHTNYDAFVCCILTHGKLGVIYTSDGKPVEILKLVDFFTDRNCPSLKGKPKMFFIQACQKGDPEPETGATGNSLPQDSSTGYHFTHPSSQNTASDSAVSMEHRETVEEGIRVGISNNQGGIASIHDGISIIQDGISKLAVTEVEQPSASTLDVDATSAPTVSTLDESLPTNLKHKAVLVPGSPDFLMSYSTLPGSISYRDTQTGSLYIQSLYDCLRKDMEIDRALKMVSSSVKKNLRQRGEHDGERERFQLPFHLTSGMDRLIYL